MNSDDSEELVDGMFIHETSTKLRESGIELRLFKLNQRPPVKVKKVVKEEPDETVDITVRRSASGRTDGTTSRPYRESAPENHEMNASASARSSASMPTSAPARGAVQMRQAQSGGSPTGSQSRRSTRSPP